jgi:hypothetical protein
LHSLLAGRADGRYLEKGAIESPRNAVLSRGSAGCRPLGLVGTHSTSASSLAWVSSMAWPRGHQRVAGMVGALTLSLPWTHLCFSMGCTCLGGKNENCRPRGRVDAQSCPVFSVSLSHVCSLHAHGTCTVHFKGLFGAAASACGTENWHLLPRANHRVMMSPKGPGMQRESHSSVPITGQVSRGSQQLRTPSSWALGSSLAGSDTDAPQISVSYGRMTRRPPRCRTPRDWAS